MSEATVSYELPAETITTEAENMLEMAKSYTITTADMMEAAGIDLQAVKKKYRDLDAERKKIVKPLDEAKKAVQDLFRKPLEFLASAENTLKGAMLTFQREQDRIAREAQAKLDEEARKAREAAEKKAREAEAKGKIEKAEELREQAATIIAPVVAPTAPKLSGISTRDNWKAEVTDLVALAKYVGEHPEMASLIVANQSALNSMARVQKDAMQIPGVAVKNDTIMASRAA